MSQVWQPFRGAAAAAARSYLDLRRVAVVAITVAVLALTVAAITGVGLSRCSASSRVVPYIVRVGSEGQTLGIEPATAAAEPDRAMLEHAIRLWVDSTRTVTSHRALQRRMIDNAYAYSHGRAVTLLNEWYRENPPFGTETVTTEVTSYLEIVEDESYQVDWTETRRDPGGVEIGEELWRARVTVSVEPPADLDQRLLNPLGIRVTDFDWTRVPSSGSR